MLKLVQWMQDISDQTHGWNEFDHSSREDRVVEEDSILHVQGVRKIDICEHPVHTAAQKSNCDILDLGFVFNHEYLSQFFLKFKKQVQC